MSSWGVAIFERCRDQAFDVRPCLVVGEKCLELLGTESEERALRIDDIDVAE